MSGILNPHQRWLPSEKRVAENAAYLEGMAAVHPDPGMQYKLKCCAIDMRKFADIQRNFCGKGYLCNGGPTCASDHK